MSDSTAPAAPPPFILVATLGGHDVHLVVTLNDGRRVRAALETSSILSFHQWCLENPDAWQVLPLKETLDVREEAKGFSYHFDGRSQLVPVHPAMHPLYPVIGTDLPLTLCTHPLARTWNNIQQMQEAGRLGPALHVLLLNTRRIDPLPQEPIAAGTIARVPLASAMGLSQSKVEELNYLTKPDMLVCDSTGQQHLDPASARKIDDRLQQLAQHDYADKCPTVALADIAGRAEVKPVVLASCRLRFDGRIIFPRAPEIATRATPLLRSLIPPDESLQTRHIITRLVKQGAFDLAAALALPPQSDERYSTEPWRAWLTVVAAALRGDWSLFERLRGETSPPSRMIARLRILDGIITSPRSEQAGRVHREGSLIIAFRVESALRREDWTWAIRDTLTLGDALRIDLFNRHFSADRETVCSDDLQRDVAPDRIQLHVLQFLKREFAEFDPSQNTKREKKGVNWRLDKVWDKLDFLLPDEARQELTKLRNANTRNRKFQYRHMATHGALSDSHLRTAIQLFENDGLWAPHGTMKFLDGKYIIPALRTLGIQNPSGLYQELSDAVLADMDDYSFLEL